MSTLVVRVCHHCQSGIETVSAASLAAPKLRRKKAPDFRGFEDCGIDQKINKAQRMALWHQSLAWCFRRIYSRYR